MYVIDCENDQKLIDTRSLWTEKSLQALNERCAELSLIFQLFSISLWQWALCKYHFFEYCDLVSYSQWCVPTSKNLIKVNSSCRRCIFEDIQVLRWFDIPNCSFQALIDYSTVLLCSRELDLKVMCIYMYLSKIFMGWSWLWYIMCYSRYPMNDRIKLSIKGIAEQGLAVSGAWRCG